jgi:hypothetical protein
MLVLSEPRAIVQTLETVHVPLWETLTHLKIYTPDYQPLSWAQVWQAFVAVYPERWAVEFFPPTEDLVNDAHIYHLWLLPEVHTLPDSLNLAHKYRW